MDPLLRCILHRVDLLPHCQPFSDSYKITERGGERWVTLFGDPGRIPEGAAELRRKDNLAARDRDVGRLQRAYRGQASWFSDRKPWAAYVPDVVGRFGRDGQGTTAWMFADYTTTPEHLDATYLDRISTALCTLVLNDFSTLKDILEDLQAYMDTRSPALPTDMPLVARILDTYRGEGESLIAILRCREAMIERLGAVSYGLDRVPERARSEIVARHGPQLRAWRVLGCSKLGVLLDLSETADNDIPLVDFYRDAIPVHYSIDDPLKQQLPESLNPSLVLNPENVGTALYFAARHATSELLERGADACAEEVANAYGREPTHDELIEFWHGGQPLPSDGSPTPSLREYALIEEIESISRDPLSTLRPFLFTLSAPLLPAQDHWAESIMNNAHLLIGELEEAKLRAYAKSLRTTKVEGVLSLLVQDRIRWPVAIAAPQP